MVGRLQPMLRSGARRPRARELGAVTAGTHSRAHTPSGGFPLATTVADTKGASARVFVVSPYPAPSPYFSQRRSKQQLAPGNPHVWGFVGERGNNL